MTTQHTPGPWTTDGKAETDTLDIVSPLGRVAMLDCSHDLMLEDARLIAAAPDLLIALEACLHRLAHHDDQSVPECEMAQAAIDKAIGASNHG
jgi:hypothetical protein